MCLSRFGWAFGVVAPWCLGVGLAFSFPADAGQPIGFGASSAALTLAAAMPNDLVPASSAALTGDLGALTRLPLQQASLVVGPPEAFTAAADEIEPRSDLKRSATRANPDIDRTHKGDPTVGLRPTFDTRMRERGGVQRVRLSDVIFSIDEATPTGALSPNDGDTDGPDNVAHFEPWADGENPTTIHTVGESSPGTRDGATMTMRPAAINERIIQGATPAVGRAVALASTTPAAADATPVEASFLPSDGVVNVPRFTPDRPNYAALVSREHEAQEKKCLAEAIYFEARSEPVGGQAAVAQVVLNRVSSGLYPTSICGVVYQNRHRTNACQFSFACEGKSLRVTESEPWRTAVKVADDVLNGTTYLSDVGGSTHYHANYVRPRWARSLVKMDVIGRHVFYKLRAGQT